MSKFNRSNYFCRYNNNNKKIKTKSQYEFQCMQRTVYTLYKVDRKILKTLDEFL